MVLVLLALLPAAAVLMRTTWLQHEAALRQAEDRLDRASMLMAERQEHVFTATLGTLQVLARTDSLRAERAADTRSLLADVQRSGERYANLGVVRPDGSLVASVMPVPAGTNLSDRSYVDQALATESPAVGEYQEGRITGRPSVNVAVPFRTRAGAPRVLFAALDVSRLHEELARTALAEGTVLEVRDRSGTQMFRHPPGEAGDLPDARLAPARGVTQLDSASGATFLVSTAPVTDATGRVLASLAVHRPLHAITAAASTALIEGLAWLALATLLAVAAAWFVGNRLVVLPLGRVEQAADRVARGEHGVRIGEPYQRGAVGGLERGFDAMAASLERERGERAQAGAEVEAIAARFKLLAETVEDVFWISEPGPSPLKYVSPAFERLFGIPAEDVCSNHQLWVEAIHPSDRERVRADIARHEEAGTYDVVYRIVRPDSQVRWIRDKAFPVRNEEGRVTRIVGLCEDVTRSKELEQQFLQSQKMEAMGRVAAGVAHDFNNLLTVVVGYSELAAANVDERGRALIAQVLAAASQAGRLTAQLLAFSRKQVLDPESLDVPELVEDSRQMLTHVLGPQFELVVVPPRGMGRVHCDANQLRQVLMNLVVNARDAMREGGRVTLEFYDVDVDEGYAESHLQQRPGPYVVLSVTDTGQGMDEQTRARIFEPFFTTKVSGKGTGLGLATVKGFVEQTGGDVFVYSEPGVGTTFKIYLPRYEGPDAVPAPTSDSDTALPDRLLILLVDDDSMVRELLFRMLRTRGHAVLTAPSGEEALAAIEGHDGPIDLLISDIAMREMDGFALVERVREIQPACPVVLMSGYSDAPSSGLPRCTTFLAKPFGPAELFAAVKLVLRSSTAERA